MGTTTRFHGEITKNISDILSYLGVNVSFLSIVSCSNDL